MNETANRGTVEVSAPGGWRARLTGIDTKIILLALLMIVGIGGSLYAWEEGKRLDRAAQTMYLDNHRMTQQLIGQVITNQKAILDMLMETRRAAKEDIGEITYVLSLPQAQRDRLRLEMPASLRRKLVGQQQ